MGRSGNSLRVSIISVLLGVSFGLLPSSAIAQSDKIPGMSIGSLSVDNNGASNFSIPIITPPSFGPQPKLSIGYSSQGSNGLMGMGFSLTGLSSIHRCPRTIAQDQAKGGIFYDQNDRYCLDGQRLIVISGTDGGNGAEYRTEIDSFLKIFSYTTPSITTGPSYWKVQNKAGETMEFGGNADTTTANQAHEGRILAQGKSAVRVWALSRVRSIAGLGTVGNSMTVTYQQDTTDATNGDYRPDTISYTANDYGVGVTAQRSVQFVYENRPDQVPTYSGGSIVKMLKRLTNIKTYVSSSLVRNYFMTYETGFGTKRSRLQSIVECSIDDINCQPQKYVTTCVYDSESDQTICTTDLVDPACLGNGTCLPTNVFQWQDTSLGQAFNMQLPTWSVSLSGSVKLNLVGDFNGDGKSDIVVRTGSSTCSVYLSNGTGFNSPLNVSCTLDGTNNINLVGDFNGDGKADILARTGTSTCKLHRFNGTGFDMNDVSCNLNTTFNNNFVGDFDGDGRTDVVSKTSSTCSYQISTGTNFSVTNNVACNLNTSGFSYAGDFNGDGKTDIVSKNGGGCDMNLSTGTGFTLTPWSCSPGLNSNGINYVGDFNGDGKADIAAKNNNTCDVYLSTGALSTGGGFDHQTWDCTGMDGTLGINFVADFNGDGLADIIARTSSSACAGFVSTGYSFVVKTWGCTLDGNAPSQNYLGDFNGDGKTDILAKNSSTTAIAHLTIDPLPDLLSKVTNNMGGKYNITYKPLTDSNVYTKETDPNLLAMFPVQDVQAPMYVVDNYTADTGFGQTYTFTYDYAGAKTHVQGRGWMGFRTTTAVNADAGSKEVHTFRQVKNDQNHTIDYPFVGQVDNSQNQDLDGNLFAQVRYEYESIATLPNQPKVTFVSKKREVKDACDGLTTQVSLPTCFETATTVEYDSDLVNHTTMGNLVHTFYEGDVSTANDDRHEKIEYIVDTNLWLHRPKHTMLLKSDNATIVREKFLYYDEQAYGVLGGRGLLTREESGLAGGAGNAGNPAIIYHNNELGIRYSTTDPINCETRTTAFDTTKTFPATVVRCYGDPDSTLVHMTGFTYDTRFGTKTKEAGPCICTDPINDAGAPKTSYTYDVFGRLTKLVGPIDTDTHPTETRQYLNWSDPANQQIVVNRLKDVASPPAQDAIVSRYDYFDGLGRFDFIKSTGPNDPNTGSPRLIVEQSIYDSRGLIIEKTPPYFEGDTPICDLTQHLCWHYTYDSLGRQVQVDHPDTRYSQTIYTPGKITLIDERQKQKVKYLDGFAQPVRIDEMQIVGGNPQIYATTLYEYDTAGKLFHVVNNSSHNTWMTYDLIGRKIAMCDPNMGAGPNPTKSGGLAGCDTNTTGAWIYTYDLAGNLLTQADAKQRAHNPPQSLTFSYDSHSRMSYKNYPDTTHIDFHYDTCTFGVGRLCHVDDLNSMTTDFSYNADGTVGQTQRYIDGHTYTMGQTYNHLGKVLQETFPDLDFANYTYNEAGWLNSIQVSGSNYVVQNITYNARGLRTEMDYGNGVVTTFDYYDHSSDDIINFAVKARATLGPSTALDPDRILQDLSYKYDNMNNIRMIKDLKFTGSRNFGIDPDGILPDEDRYDDLNRLIKASGRFGPLQNGVPTELANPCNYNYDQIGNMTSKCGITYHYDNAMYPSFVTSRDDNKTYAPDINGNTASGDGRSFSWTQDNRVAYVTVGSTTTTMEYDYAGARVKKTSGSSVTLYPFPGYEIAPDLSKTKYFRAGTEIVGSKRWAVGTGCDTNPPPESCFTKFFYHSDHLGGINVITDKDGARVQLDEYDPWGKISRHWSANTPPPEVEKRFTGKVFDAETGLYYYGARYYDPELARFISPDPIVPQATDPQTLNRYSYTINNPVKYIDPSGHSFWSAIGNFFKNLFRRPEVFFVTLIVGVVTGWAALALAPLIGITNATVALAFSGAVGGAFAGLTNAGMTGGNLWQGMLLGAIGGAIGGAVAGAVGGSAIANTAGVITGFKVTFSGIVTGAFAGGFVSGGLGTVFHGGNFIENALGGGLVAGSLGALFGAAKSFYESVVQYEVDPASGVDAVQKGPQTPPIRGANNIGTQGQSPGSCFGCEGGPLSRFLNRIPGINAVSGLHDWIVTRFPDTSFMRATFGPINIPSMIPAALITYTALAAYGPTGGLYNFRSNDGGCNFNNC